LSRRTRQKKIYIINALIEQHCIYTSVVRYLIATVVKYRTGKARDESDSHLQRNLVIGPRLLPSDPHVFNSVDLLLIQRRTSPFALRGNVSIERVARELTRKGGRV